MAKNITVANLIFMIGGLFTILFSLFGFVGIGDLSYSAWTTEFGLFPLAVIPAILGLAAVVVGVLELLGTVKLPPHVLTFNWKQIKVTWGIAATAIMLGYLVMDKSGLSLKFGAWLMFLGSVAMAVGSIMDILGKGANTLNIPGGQAAPGAGHGAPPPPPPPPPPYGTSTPPPPPPPPPGY
jgi:hypothetical protein